MPRGKRLIVPNCPHHIVQRGHDRKAVCICEDDFKNYLTTLEETKKELDVAVYAYCLMTNHVHLIVDPKDNPENLSLLMKKLSSKQTRYVNKLEGRTGTLWESRYKSSPIQTDAYLLQCSRYVELNPVKAKMVKQAEDWPWSSYQEKVGSRELDWLDFDECYLGLADTTKHRQRHYREFVEACEVDSTNEKIRLALDRCQLTGTSYFVDEIERRMGLRVESRGQGRPRKGGGCEK